MVTTYSGHVPYIENPDNAAQTPAAKDYKYDLTWQDGSNTENNQPRIEAIYDRVAQALNNVPFTSLTAAADQERFASVFALNVQDYTDRDKKPSGRPLTNFPAGTFMFGYENVPFLRKVHLQVAYDHFDTDGDGAFDTHRAVPNSHAWAIEFGNPTNHQLTINTPDGPFVRLAVRKDNDPPSYAYSLFGVFNGHSRSIFMANGSAMQNNSSGTGGTDLYADLNLGFTRILQASYPAGSLLDDRVLDATGQTTPTLPLGGGNWKVELQVSCHPGPDGVWANGDDIWVTYDRITTRPLASEYTVGPSVTQNNTHGFVEATRNTSELTPGSGIPSIRYISNVGMAQLAKVDMAADSIASANSTSRFESLTGDATTTNIPNGFQFVHPDRKLYSLTELAMMPLIGLSNNSSAMGTYNEQFNTFFGTAPIDASNPATWPHMGGTLLLGVPRTPANPVPWKPYLDFTDADATNPNNRAAFAILDQFAVRTPMFDGANNDGDREVVSPFGSLADESIVNGVDDNGDGVVDDIGEAEHFIPGTININTIPKHLLALVMPLPELPYHADAPNPHSLAETIDAYRTNANTWRATNMTSYVAIPTHTGIKSIWELAILNPVTPTTLVNAGADDSEGNMSYYGHNGSNERATTVDLYPASEEPEISRNIGYGDGIEEEFGRLQFLTQAFTTRSDIFTAYIVIRSDDDAIEKRAIYIFDRSRARHGEVEVIGSFEY